MNTLNVITTIGIGHLIWLTKKLWLQSLHAPVLKNVLDITFLAQVLCFMVGCINDHNDHMVIVVMMMMMLHLLSFYYIYALQIFYYRFNLYHKSVFPKYILYNCFLQDFTNKQKTFCGDKIKTEILHVLEPTWKFSYSRF